MRPPTESTGLARAWRRGVDEVVVVGWTVNSKLDVEDDGGRFGALAEAGT